MAGCEYAAYWEMGGYVYWTLLSSQEDSQYTQGMIFLMAGLQFHRKYGQTPF